VCKQRVGTLRDPARKKARDEGQNTQSDSWSRPRKKRAEVSGRRPVLHVATIDNESEQKRTSTRVRNRAGPGAHNGNQAACGGGNLFLGNRGEETKRAETPVLNQEFGKGDRPFKGGYPPSEGQNYDFLRGGGREKERCSTKIQAISRAEQEVV